MIKPPLDAPIHFSRRKIIYILSYLNTFRSGTIPDFRVTGYTQSEHVSHAIRQMASFVPAVELAAEATMRVERARSDGSLAMLVYAYGVPVEKLARLMNCETVDIWQRVNRALRYASNDECLIIGYRQWRRINHR